MATARRYSATPEDAEDAYQRGLEILLTKAPTTDESELVPWLRTVIKHEAFALRRQRERHSPVTDDGELADPGTAAGATHDQAERWSGCTTAPRRSAGSSRRSCARCCSRPRGTPTSEICEITGWTYTKVNRCLTEGRRAFSERLDEIQAGAECERLAGRLSALADGEASAADLTLLRPHLRTCLACRTRLREFRTAPARVAALAPPLALGGRPRRRPPRHARVARGAAQHKAAALGERANAAAELVAGQKVAAVAASAAALAGGGTAVDHLTTADHRPMPVPAQVRTVAESVPAPEAPVAEPTPVTPAPVTPATAARGDGAAGPAQARAGPGVRSGRGPGRRHACRGPRSRRHRVRSRRLSPQHGRSGRRVRPLARGYSPTQIASAIDRRAGLEG